VKTVCKNLDDKMSENTSVDQRQTEEFSQKMNQEIEVLKKR
jgi:hypothetical protein